MLPFMAQVLEFLKQNRPAVVLMGIVLVLTAIPALDTYLVLGDPLPVIAPTFTDETFNYARVQPIVEGHLTGGHPYFFEHRDDLPLVIFAGAWINAIPQLAGLSFNTALVFNFILWSLLFAVFAYWLFIELRTPPWIAVAGTVLLYLQSYAHVWRPINLQPVYPFYFLFHIALARLLREQSRRNSYLLGFATGAAFYLQSYIWQTFVVTLGVLFLYALLRKHWPLLKAALLASLLGGAIGFPVPLYALWLAHASPYFWESVGRLGLVNSHLPMAEVIYSGGWIGVMLALLGLLYGRGLVMRKNAEFVLLGSFISIGGLGLWVMQGSNLITGKLLETGEHIRPLIMLWLVFSTISVGVLLWHMRTQLSRGLQTLSIAVVMLLSGVGLYYTYDFFSPFLPAYIDVAAWKTQESYAKPFAWLQSNETSPVVVWSDPHDYLAINLPIFTRHYTLYNFFALLELVPEGEIRERYLISQYFNDPSTAYLKSDREAGMYLGRRDFPHQAKTVERGVKICRILFFWDKGKNCGVIPTPQSLLGDQFFNNLENKFQNDIKPNIKAYLKKYHISYILKDKVFNPKYRPEALGAELVYSDDRYEIWRLQ
jgi:hypothetical protein